MRIKDASKGVRTRITGVEAQLRRLTWLLAIVGVEVALVFLARLF